MAAGDNKSAIFTGHLIGTGTIHAELEGLSGDSGLLTVIPGLKDHLKITGNTSMTAGTTNELTITAYDQFDNIVISYAGLKNLTFSGLGNALDGTVPTVEGTDLGTATSINFTNGVSDSGAGTLIAYKAETAHLDVTDGTIGTSASISYGLDLTVNPGPANTIIFTKQPGDTNQNDPIIPNPTVELIDQWGNLVTTDNSTTVTVSIGNNPGSGTLGGTSTGTASGGIVSFTDLTIDQPGTGYTLGAQAGQLSTISSTFNIISIAPALTPIPVPALEHIRYKWPYLEQLEPKQITPFDFLTSTDYAGPLYAYHPLTETDASAFDAMTIEEGAYEFIGGSINIRGHDGLLPLLEEVKRKKRL